MQRRMKRLARRLSTVRTVGACLAGSVAMAPPAAAADAAPTFAPAHCQLVDVPADWARENPVDCGWVTVPAHRGAPSSGMLRLWVFRVRAYADRPPGEARAIIRMAGGSLPRTQNMATLDSFASRLARRTHDVVFFDYRGVGQSEPSITCHVEPVSGLVASERLKSKIAQYRKCRGQIDAAGIDLSAISSRENGRDVADIARAMGYRRYAVRAESYASLPAFDLIRARPDGLEAAAIGLVSPPNSPLSNFISALGDAMERWQAACDRQPACRRRFPNLAALLGRAFDRVERERLVVAGKRLSPADIADAIFGLGFDSATLPFVPLAIETAASGDATVISRWFTAFPPGDFTMPDMTEKLSPIHVTLTCAEGPPGRSYRSLLRQGIEHYPYLRRAAQPEAAVDRLCRAWRYNRAPVDLFAAPAGGIPVLLTSAALDSSRSPEDASLAAKTLFNATVVTLPGRTHLAQQSDCQYAIEAAFLANPAAPIDRGCVDAMTDPAFALEGFEGYLDGLR